MRVVGYCRVSTLEQAVNGTSTESQVISIKNECRKLNYQLIDIYIDDGVSGKGNDRPELNRLRGDAKSNKFDAPRKQFTQYLDHPDIIYEPGKCIDCGLCIQTTQKQKEELFAQD